MAARSLSARRAAAPVLAALPLLLLLLLLLCVSGASAQGPVYRESTMAEGPPLMLAGAAGAGSVDGGHLPGRGGLLRPPPRPGSCDSPPGRPRSSGSRRL
jgi:hypothetical protein